MIFDMTKRKSGGGSGYTADDWLDNSKPVGNIRSSTYRSTGQYSVYASLFNKTGIAHVSIENSPWIEQNFASNSSITLFAGYKTHSVAGNAFQNCYNLATVDLGGNPATAGAITAHAFRNDTHITTLIIRSETITSVTNTSFAGSSLVGTGCTIYIPKSLYDHLGDGTENDYKAATNWSTLDAGGAITWAAIEGSQYETQYADGTPIPTA